MGRNAVRFHFFTRLRDVILRQHSWGKERNLCGRPGKCTLKPQRLDINNPVFDVLQHFVVILYDRASLATDVNTARRELFTKKNRALENIPPTEVRTYHTHNLVVFEYDTLN